MKALFFVTVVVATVGFAACGGNVVVDPASSKGTGNAASSSQSVASTGVGTPETDATSSVGTNTGVGGAIANPAGTTVAVGAGGAPVMTTGSGPCSQTCNDTVNQQNPSSVAPPPCGGVALQDYDALMACGCTTSTCITECGANLCTHLLPSNPCYFCLKGSCGNELVACQGN